jgi:transposase, mutator family
MIRLWRNAWTEFVPFLDHDIEIRKVLCATNTIEPLNARSRKGCSRPRSLPERASRIEETLYLTARSLDPKGHQTNPLGHALEPTLNTFANTFTDRMPTANTHQ